MRSRCLPGRYRTKARPRNDIRNDATHSDGQCPPSNSRNVSYRLKTRHELLRNLNLEVRRGETLVLLGRSGSGKTTTLKLINRLLVQAGDIFVNGRSLASGTSSDCAASSATSFRKSACFPISPSPATLAWFRRSKDWPAEQIHKRVKELLQLVGLEPQLASRYPRELSGGQRQRVGRGPGPGCRSANPADGRAFRRARSHHSRRIAA